MGEGTTVVCSQGVMKRGFNSEHEALERGGLDAIEWLASLQ
jgi:hypothetical protein